jgi:hypothetical protein
MIDQSHNCADQASQRHKDNFDDEVDERDRKRLEAEHRKALDAALDRGLEDTFPGSDPVAVTQPPRSAYDKGEA